MPPGMITRTIFSGLEAAISTFSVKWPLKASKTYILFSLEEHLVFCARLFSAVLPPVVLSSIRSHYIEI
jgi:hypothetical protein